MRELLEYLGLVAPDAGRREPVALPAWARRLGPLLAGAMTIGSLGLYALVRALTG